MRLPHMPKGNGGFTLVELLVVILIIVILSVTMLPLLKPFVTKAQYAAEGVPVIGNLRTKVELYRIEKDHLPGMMLDSSGKLAVYHSMENDNYYIQSYSTNNIAMMDKSANLIDTNITTSAFYDANYHVFKQIDVDYADLTGKRLRPYHFQYVVPFCNGESYCWAIGVFGDGGTLPKGTGYAVLEFNCPTAKSKFVATFERYKVTSNDANLTFAPGSGFNGSPSSETDVWIPNFIDLWDAATGATEITDENIARSKVEGFKTTLRKYGWDVQ